MGRDFKISLCVGILLLMLALFLWNEISFFFLGMGIVALGIGAMTLINRKLTPKEEREEKETPRL